MTVQATFAATLVDEWVRAGVTDAVLCPGSRSTPLALALAASPLRLHVHLDERVAGFFALGLGLHSGRPAVVLTTSGTAAVELHPAIVEASQARVPLIACTADRPAEMHGVYAPQTVEQSRLFRDAVRWFVEPGAPAGVPPTAWRSLASRLVAEATSGPLGPGPVHANLAFAEPLVGDADPLPSGRADGAPWHRAVAAVSHPPDVDVDWSGRRGVVVVGGGASGAASGDVLAFASALGWPVLADPRSGCRGASDLVVAAFDGILRCEAFAATHVPEVVVRVGAPPASKVLSQWMALLPDDVEQCVVDPFGAWPDPERRASLRLPALPLLGAQERQGDPSWLADWQRAEARAQAAIDDVLASWPATNEPATVRALTRDLPEHTTLFVSSSMPIRDVEWFGHPSSRHRVLANRGANGIDGVLATAIGVAAAAGGAPVVAVVGDLAFLYDASALLWANQREIDLTIVVLDNGGGGIFSFLPQRDVVPADRFERLFGTPHGVDVTAVARAYGMHVRHVRTNRDDNVRLHARLNAAIAAAITA